MDYSLPFKICFVCQRYPLFPPFGGIERVTAVNARALARAGHDVHILVTGLKENRDLMDDGVHIHLRPVRHLPVVARWLGGFGESFLTAKWLRKLQRQFGFDFVEMPNWEGQAFFSVLARVAPIALRHHTSMSNTMVATKREMSPSQKSLIWLEKHAFRLCRHNFTHSQYQKEQLEQTLAGKVIHIIPHGIELGDDDVRPPRSQGKPYLLYLGALNSRKGTPILLEAFTRVLQALPAARLVLVGDDKKQNYERQFFAEQAKISPQQVSFRSFLPDDELPALYQNCRAFVSPSVYESFGYTFLEAMKYGKATIGCRSGAVPEVVEHGVTGLLVEKNDPKTLAEAMARLLSDAPYAKQLGLAGRQRAERLYDLEAVAKNYREYITLTKAQRK